jgi:imidazolonepropionase-like amidohydrolase
VTGAVRLRAARVFDGRELTDRPTVVEIEDGEIRAVRPAEGVAEATDLGDVTLLPGLIDAHVHLAFAGSDEAGYGLPREPGELAERVAANAERVLDAGITAVRDLGDQDGVVLAAAAAGRLPIAVAASGPPLTTPTGHCAALWSALDLPADPAAAVPELAARGARVIKVMATGGAGTPGSDPVRAQFDLATMRRIVTAAHAAGLPVTAHAHGRDGVAIAVQAGVDGLEHAKFWTAGGIGADPAVIDTIAARGILVCPTLGALPGSAPPPPAVAGRAAESAAVVLRMHRAGVPLVSGSDAGITAAKGFDVLPFSIQALAATGVDAVTALRSATSLAAAACRFAGKGELRPGADADLLAVAGDPVRDLAALREVTSVWVGGRQVRAGVVAYG